MSKLSHLNLTAINALRRKIEEGVRDSTSLEEAARQFVDTIYGEFADSLVLARLFATVPFEKLPPPNKEIVSSLADSKGISRLLNDRTLILALLGTRGKESAWNDRRTSRGHAGIPLASAEFIDSIPMVSRLLKELGAGIDWIDKADTKIVIRTAGSMAGVFFVLDAQTATDHQGRKIISAQDFVDEYGVKTVFGLGGLYGVGNTFITSIFFTNETLERQQVEQLMFFINMLKSATTVLVLQGKIFA